VIAGNGYIGAKFGAQAQPAIGPPPFAYVYGYGIDCDEGSCPRVSNNTIVGADSAVDGLGTSYAQFSGYGVTLGSSKTLLSGNVITGANATGRCRTSAYGVTATNGGARIENNAITGVIGGGFCLLVIDDAQKGIALSTNGDADVHSNLLRGSPAGCGPVPPGSPIYGGPPVSLLLNGRGGRFRNNSLVSCGFAVVEASANADPELFENNAIANDYANFTLSGYLDELSSPKTASEVNALTDMTTSGNIAAVCSSAGDGTLSAGSACIDAGTTHGAPNRDRNGDPRGATPDIGPDEYQQ
jgi:hypothetical protein